MNLLLITTFVIWVITAAVEGFNLHVVIALITTLMFCARKFKYFAKPTTLVTMEAVSYFVTVATQLLLHRFSWKECVIVIILRLVFIGIVYYDTTMFVYETVEERKDNEE